MVRNAMSAAINKPVMNKDKKEICDQISIHN